MSINGISSHSQADVLLLEECMSQSRCTKRGTLMNGTVDAGFMVQRGKTGISLSPLMKKCSLFRGRVEDYYKRVEDIAIRFLPHTMVKNFSLLRDEISPFDTLGGNGTSSAMSVAVDHISALHVDKDFFLTYLTSRCSMVDGYDWNRNVNAPVSYHFIFPSVGYSVSLRPGDVLIFNPLLHHCCSHKLKEYNGIPVYLSSFYVKTGNVGGNDNMRPITTVENEILGR